MNFLKLQNELELLTMDTRTERLNWWANNKSAINYWLWEVFEKFVNTYSWQELMRTEKIKLTLTWSTANLPADFRCLAITESSGWVFYYTSNQYVPVNENIIYKIKFWTPYTIQFNSEPKFDIYIDYIKDFTELTLDADIPLLPVQLHQNILDFALVKYFREQRDWGNVWNAMQYAEWKLMESIGQIWNS
jgi:hypothetical protein